MTDSSDNQFTEDTESHETGLFLNRIIRTEAIATLCIILLLLSVYAYFFLDNHLRWAFEEGLSRSNGAQVDIHDLKTSFTDPAIQLRRVQFTNPRKPTHNIVEFGELSVSLSWSGLLRSKLLFENIQLQELAYGTERASPGRVREEGGAIGKLFRSLYELTATQIKQQSRGTLLENVISLLEGADSEQQLDQMKDDLKSPEQINEIRQNLSDLKKSWDQQLETLPGTDELDRMKKELKTLKSSKSNPAQMAGKLKEIKEIVNRLNKVSEKVKDFQASFKKQYSNLRNQIDSLKATVDEDRETLRKRFQLPSLDLETFSRQLFRNFLDQQIHSYSSIIDRGREYVPAGINPVRQPAGHHPRQEGVNYIFRTIHSYPAWWVKQARLDANVPSSLGGGEIHVDLEHLSSNPTAVDQPALVSLKGNLPRAPVGEFEGLLKMDHREEVPVDKFDVKLENVSIRDFPLLDSPKYQFAVEKAIGLIKSSGTLRGSSLDASLKAQFDRPRFRINSQIEWLRSVLQSAIQSLKEISLDAQARGVLENLSWTVQSNLGGLLGNTLENQVRNQISRSKENLVSKFNKQIGGQTSSLTGNTSELHSLVTGRLGSVDSRVNNLKELASGKTAKFQDLIKGKDGSSSGKQNDLLKSLGDKLNF